MACSLGMALKSQTVIDPLTGSLSGYTSTVILNNADGADGDGATFTDSGSGLQANFVGTVSDPEQALFLAPASSFSTTFAVGDILSVDVTVPNGPQSGSATADFGLAIASTATPTPAGSGNSWNSRTTFDYATISVRPPQSAIRSNLSYSGEAGAPVSTGGTVSSVSSSTVTELYIQWDSAYVFTLGYSTGSGLIPDETVTFADDNPNIATAIGFYTDQRDQDGITGTGDFTDLTISPAPEPSSMALCGMGLIGSLLALRRRK